MPRRYQKSWTIINERGHIIAADILHFVEAFDRLVRYTNGNPCYGIKIDEWHMLMEAYLEHELVWEGEPPTKLKCRICGYIQGGVDYGGL